MNLSSEVYNLKSLKKLCKENKISLSIPNLQRDYVWRKKEWEALWDDIKRIYYNWENGEANTASNQLFLGIMTIQKDSYDVLDGQQRLTTLTILLDYLCDYIAFKNQTDDENQQPDKYAGIGIQINDIHVSRSCPLSGIQTKDIYEEAYNSFAKFYAEVEREVNPDDLVRIIRSRLFFIVNFVDEQDDKHAIFEQINATGKPLVFADLILNYLIELGGMDENGNQLTAEYIRASFKDILQLIYQEKLLPEDEEPINDEDDEDDKCDECDEETEEDASLDLANNNVDMTSATEDLDIDELYKPLKFKKYMNALHSLTLPKNKSIEESVDGFARVFYRMRRSYRIADGCAYDAFYILNELKKWSKPYTIYLCPSDLCPSDTIYREVCFLKNLSYLRAINMTSILPVIMRVLYAYQCKELNEQDVDCIFHAMVTTILLKKLYVERDNQKSLARKLLYVDFIYKAMEPPKRGYYALLNALDDISKYQDALEDDRKRNMEKDEKVSLWNAEFKNGITTAFLAISHDATCDEADYFYKGFKDTKDHPSYELRELVSAKDEFGDYGYEAVHLSQMWNKVLVKKDEEANNVDRNKNSQTNRLQELYQHFYDYISLKKEVIDNSKCDVFRFVSYQYENGEVVGFCLEQLNEIEPDLKNYVFSLNQGKFYAEPSDVSGANETEAYWVRYRSKKDAVRIDLKKYAEDVEDIELADNKKAQALIIFIESAIEVALANKLPEIEPTKQNIDELRLRVEGEIYDLISNDINAVENNNKAVSNLPFFTQEFFEKQLASRGQFMTEITMKRWGNYVFHSNDYGINLGNGKVIYVNGNTGDKVIVSGLRNIYAEYYKKYGVSFGFWLEMRRGEMQYIQGIRRITRYVNVADVSMYENFVQNEIEHEKIVDSTLMIEKKETGLIDTKSYVAVDVKSLDDIYRMLCNSNHSFYIPEYQRNYVWDNDNLQALLDSILGDHCNLGTIIVSHADKNGASVYSLVDGQQRLTSIDLLWRQLLKRLNATGMDFVYDNQNESSVGRLSTKKKASRFFETALKNYDSEQLKEVFEKMKKIQFSVIEISKNAPNIFQYQVFAAINGKGKKLSLEEKVNNFLYKKYPNEKDKEKIIRKMISTKGFIKAYTEMNKKTHVSEADLFSEFCRCVKNQSIQSLDKARKTYAVLKLNNNKKIRIPCLNKADKEQTAEFYVWISLYRELRVSTADAILLDAMLQEKNINRMLCLLQNVITMYFLLYVDDEDGNSKKSINKKLPVLVGKDIRNQFMKETNQDGSLILDDLLRGNFAQFNLYDYIWGKIEVVDLIRYTKRNIARFLLYLLEIWYGRTKDNQFSWEKVEDMINQGVPDIEHIFPANPAEEEFPKDFVRPEYLFRLQNVCLLEASINRAVGNGMMVVNNAMKNGKKVCHKLGVYKGEAQVSVHKATYAYSKYPMAMAFYENDEANPQIRKLYTPYVLLDDNKKVGYYGKEQAMKRICDLKKVIAETEENLYRTMLDNLLLDNLLN